MRAIITQAYGSVDVLNIENVDKPEIDDDEILVEVRAASINPIDWKIRNGEMKIITGKTPPRILGCDYSGVVSQTGKNITSYKKADEVFGMLNPFKVKAGTYAELVKVNEKDICLKPKGCSFAEAASLPVVGITAYMALVNIAQVKKDSNVLINGCTGGVGSVAVQIAKALGCKTTGVCSTKNIDFAKKLGVDAVIDYKQKEVLKPYPEYAVVFDTVGNLTFSKAKASLKPGGIYVTTVATLPGMLTAPLANIFRSKKLKIVMSAPDSNILNTIKKMVEDGKLAGQVFKTFSLEQIKTAHNLSRHGGFCGKLVVEM